jgi:aspartyl-tRNA(Asn)/glutamyl-tRNA(Gln) amidotransferase subunit A
VNDYAKAFSRFDCLIGPVSPGPARPLGATKNQPMFGELEDMLLEASSIAGLTGLSVPCGFVDGLPIGLQITAAQKAEAMVIKVGRAYQSATSFHWERPAL